VTATAPLLAFSHAQEHQGTWHTKPASTCAFC
jgi:hypothetical protein